MKKKILTYILAIFTFGFSFLTWNSINQAINAPDASLWLGPIVFFSLTFIFLILTIVLVKKRNIAQGVSLGVIFFSLIFTPVFWNFLVLVLCYALISIAIGKVRKDLALSIKIDFYKSIRAGGVFLLLACSLSISSHYFFETKNTRLENIIPKFNMSGLVSTFAPKIISSINPEFKNIDDADLTVDEWILETEKSETANSLEYNSRLTKTEKELILIQGRAYVKDFTGIEVSGQEKMSAIIAQMVSEKISNFVAPDYSKGKVPIFPLVVSGALFLTLFSLGSFFRPFWTWIAEFIFWILWKAKVVKIVEEMRDVEVIQ